MKGAYRMTTPTASRGDGSAWITREAGRVHRRRRRAAVGRPESRKATSRPESHETRMTTALLLRRR